MRSPHQAAAQVAQRGHVALTCVLDRSGSMSGERIALVQETCHFLIDQLSEDDYLGQYRATGSHQPVARQAYRVLNCILPTCPSTTCNYRTGFYTVSFLPQLNAVRHSSHHACTCASHNYTPLQL